jgi:hypothetical protein
MGAGINSLIFPELFVAEIYRSTCILLFFLIQLPVVRYYIIGYLRFQETTLRPRSSNFKSSTSLEVKVISKPFQFQRNLAHK